MVEIQLTVLVITVVLDNVSSFPSTYRIENVFPSIPWHPRVCHADTAERKFRPIDSRNRIDLVYVCYRYIESDSIVVRYPTLLVTVCDFTVLPGITYQVKYKGIHGFWVRFL